MTVDTGSSMSIRNLDSLFDPRSVAVIGASERPQSVGGTLWRNMRRRFQGRGVPVNPKHTELSGRPCYARVADLPAVPELAVICTPPATVGLIEQLAQAGTQAAVVISAGQTAEQKQAMLDAARPHLLRILGPNCVGLLAPHVGLNASFAHVAAQPGRSPSSRSRARWSPPCWTGHGRSASAFRTSSRWASTPTWTLATCWTTWPATRTRAPSCCTSNRSSTRASSCRPRGRRHATSRSSSSRPGAARRGRRPRPRTPARWRRRRGVRRAIARTGMLRVNSLEQLFLAAEILTRFKAPIGDRLSILTNGGGAGVLAADAAAAQGAAGRAG
jgi:acetyltransferase